MQNFYYFVQKTFGPGNFARKQYIKYKKKKSKKTTMESIIEKSWKYMFKITSNNRKDFEINKAEKTTICFKLWTLGKLSSNLVLQ